jgi:xylan 1,4-beta-xylosidase
MPRNDMNMRYSDNGNGTFTNPAIFVDYPDPDIIRVGEDFYMVSSSFTDAPGVPVCHSKDLVNWKVIGHAYDRLPARNPGYSMADGKTIYRGGSWAPSIRHHRGIFYICFNTPAEGFFMCTSPRPEGPYEMTWFGGVELYDPGLFFDEDGRVYVVHGANDIFLTELAADAMSVKSKSIFLYATNYGNPLEGSHVYRRGGYYYICNTCRGYNGIQVVYRSKNLLGPYESRLISADDLNYSGAGLHQGGFIDLANGETWFCLFQDRDYVGRVPVLLPVTWVDGWPMLGDPKNFWRPQVTCPKPVPGTEELSIPEGSDDFDGQAIGHQWHWNHNPDESRWSLADRPGWLRLAAGPATGLMNARNTLTQKIVGHGCTGTVKLDIAALRTGDQAGVCILGFPHAYIAVERLAGGHRLVMVNDAALVAAADIKLDKIIYLRAQADREGLGKFSYSLDDKEYTPLGNDLVMQFSVKSFLGNKFGIFCFNAIPGSACGHADFDFFRYECQRSHANHYSAFEEIPWANYDAEFGTDTQRKTEKQPHQFLVNIKNDNWVRFDHIDFGPGADTFEVMASPVAQGGKIELRLDSSEGRLIGTCDLPGNGERNQWLCPWLKFGCKITTVRGVQRLCLRFVGGNGYLMRLDWLKFSNAKI